MRINERDIKLLHYLHAVKVASYKQIHRDIFPEHKYRSACNRIIQFKHLGLISGWHDRLSTEAYKVTKLSKLGFKRFVENGQEQRVELKSDSVDHDLGLVDIRSCLMNYSKVKEYYTENQIQTWWATSRCETKQSLTPLHSDAIAQVILGNEKLWAAIEYESAAKAEARYEPIVKRYYSNTDVSLVLYICSSNEVLNKIRKTEMKLFETEYPKFFYQLKPLNSSIVEDKFVNCHGRILLLDDIRTDD
jgi:hypothetical protein